MVKPWSNYWGHFFDCTYLNQTAGHSPATWSKQANGRANRHHVVSSAKWEMTQGEIIYDQVTVFCGFFSRMDWNYCCDQVTKSKISSLRANAKKFASCQTLNEVLDKRSPWMKPRIWYQPARWGKGRNDGEPQDRIKLKEMDWTKRPGGNLWWS